MTGRQAIALLLWCLGCSAAAAEETVRLTLDEAVPLPSDPMVRSAVEIDAQLGDAGLVALAACTARDYNSGTHRLTVDKQVVEEGALTVDLSIAFGADPWRPAATGRYACRIDLASGNGRFTGTVAFADHSDPVPVAADATLERVPAWPGRLPDHRPVEPGEHPRLVVRRADLPELRRRAASDLGQRVLEQLRRDGMAQDGGIGSVSEGLPTWGAAICGFAYLLDGDPALAAESARQIELVLFSSAGERYRSRVTQDIHYGPLLLGLALAYDACYDAWDPAFRSRCADEIARLTRACHDGRIDGELMRGLNCYVWSNHNAIRTSCMGIGALAILGDGDHGDLLPIIERAELDLRDHVRTGLADSGMNLEGAFYKHMTLRRGVMQFLHAARQVRGVDLLSGPLGDYYVAGEFFNDALPGELTDFPHDAFWPMLWLTVPDDLVPGCLHLWQQRDRPMGSGFTALHSLVTLPQGREAVTPGPDWPWWLHGGAKGVEIFRRLDPSLARDAGALVLLNCKGDTRRACHYERAGDWPSLDLQAFDHWWLTGRCLPVLPGVPTAINPHHGPAVVRRAEPLPHVAEIDLDLRRAYYQVLHEDATEERRMAKQSGASEMTLPNWGRLVYDHGVRGSRSLIVDTSATCGAPLLVAWLDQLTGVPAPERPEQASKEDLARMPPMLRKKVLAAQKKAATVPSSYCDLWVAQDLEADRALTDQRLTLGLADGPSLVATALAGTRWQGRRLLGEGDRYCVVLTLQDGTAPAVSQDPATGRISIGDRRLDIVDDRLRVVVDP